jgi:Cys-tRNA(Pro)/Cys-tRNA(Cys) deacylase
MGSAKTNAARLLDEAGIAYEVREYDLDLADFTAERVAEELGVEAITVFKTLVVEGDKTGPVFAVVPGGAELDLKALAKVSGNRRMTMAPVAGIEQLTGYVRGGVTVLGAKRAFPVYADETIELHDHVGVSGGSKGVQLFLAPGDYLALVGATVADIAR